VVGAGPAGLSCAFKAAAAGLQVAVVERGDVAGAKNLSGGRLYLEPLRELCPDLLEGAPFERPVVSESIVLADERASAAFRLDDEPAEGPPGSVTVLRAGFDRHLADRATEKGAFVMGEQRAERLLVEDGAAVGVQVGPEELRAGAVVAADGVLSFLAEQAGLRTERRCESFGVGIKETIDLDAHAIEERFNLAPGQGASRLYVGHVTRGMPGGAFLYTNASSLSLGLVVGVGALGGWSSEEKLWELLERFKERPDVAPLIAGGRTVEYGAHMIPEGGYPDLPRPGIPGLLLAGDAAGLVLNTGITIRGMDLAMASGVLAARAIVEAKEAGEDRSGALARYERALSGSFVVEEMKAHRRAPEVLSIGRLYQKYPSEVVRLARDVLSVDRSGRSLSMSAAFKRLRRQVLGWRGYRDLWRLSRM